MNIGYLISKPQSLLPLYSMFINITRYMNGIIKKTNIYLAKIYFFFSAAINVIFNQHFIKHILYTKTIDY